MNRHARRRTAARRTSVIQDAVVPGSLLGAIPRTLVERVFELALAIEADPDPGTVLFVDLEAATVRPLHVMLAPRELLHHVVGAGIEAQGRGVGLVVRRGVRVEAGVLGALTPHAGAA